jgi:uncharacterized membrane protein
MNKYNKNKIKYFINYKTNTISFFKLKYHLIHIYIRIISNKFIISWLILITVKSNNTKSKKYNIYFSNIFVSILIILNRNFS